MIKYIKNKSCENIPLLIDILFKKAKNNYNFAFLLYCEIKNQEFGKFCKFFNNISNIMIGTMENGFIIEKSYNTIIHLISQQNNFTQSYKNVLYPLNTKIFCKDLLVKKREVKNSFHKPILYDCIIIDKNNKQMNKQILVKKDDVRIEKIVINIINMINLILKDNDIDINTITYNIIPYKNKFGLIDIVPNSITIQEIKNKNFSIQNYIWKKIQILQLMK